MGPFPLAMDGSINARQALNTGENVVDAMSSMLEVEGQPRGGREVKCRRQCIPMVLMCFLGLLTTLVIIFQLMTQWAQKVLENDRFWELSDAFIRQVQEEKMQLNLLRNVSNNY